MHSDPVEIRAGKVAATNQELQTPDAELGSQRLGAGWEECSGKLEEEHRPVLRYRRAGGGKIGEEVCAQGAWRCGGGEGLER